MATAPNLMRKQYLVSEDNIKKIQALASTKGTSAANIVRLAIDAYDPTGFDDMDSPEFMDFVSSRLKEAISATKKANRKVSSALKTLNKVKV
jgi:hypothetical protein